MEPVSQVRLDPQNVPAISHEQGLNQWKHPTAFYLYSQPCSLFTANLGEITSIVPRDPSLGTAIILPNGLIEFSIPCDAPFGPSVYDANVGIVYVLIQPISTVFVDSDGTPIFDGDDAIQPL